MSQIPCKPDFFLFFMKMHNTINVSSSIEQAPVAPATNKTYGFATFVAAFFGVTTLGGAGVEGSESGKEILSATFQKKVIKYAPT